MSGGGNKKKPTKTQGWEEAGSEFYQESYPTDAELDALQRDPNPKHLATLLPSKQTRAAATIRIRTNDNRTIRRQTASRSRRDSTVHRRASTAGDVQVAMLPDLSENLSNEQTTWEEIMQIKGMPVPMSQKKEMKAKILNEPNLRLQGYEQLNWKRRKIWRQFISRLKEMHTKIELWRSALKRIEGHFGTGVVAYFIFLKYLLFLNLFIFTVIFLFIILPTILLVNSDTQNPPNSSNVVFDLIQGTGFMEHSLLFYGFYPNETFDYLVNESVMYYNLPLAYVCITVVYFATSLVSMVKSAANGFKERLIEGEGQFYQYCNFIFGGWDFCIHNEKSAAIKHKAIYNEIKACLAAERLEEMKQNRTKGEHTKLIIVRILVNVIVLAVLGACGTAIFFVFQEFRNESSDDYFEGLLFQFLPSITIVCFNILVPFLFKYLIQFERYSPLVVVRFTLFRTVLLRLASIFTLYITLGSVLTSSEKPNCWETFAGQQIYKLVITDFATHVILTFLVNFPRAFIARHVENKFIKLVGEQSFDLPKHVLDVVYLQTLCWLGCFYAPLLSFIASLIFFFMFYIKKFVCLVNSNPSATVYRASRSNSMFMIVLLVSFVSVVAPLAYSFSEVEPSRGCGPFRDLPSVWSRVEFTFYSTPDWVQSVVAFLSTAGFAVPVFLLLFLLLYYFRAVNAANRQMVVVLKNQLVLEGHDKQFLLERLSKFIKQQQEHQKRLRHVDVLQDGDTNISSN
ncbi:transmembrane channel-like protein 7 [Tribolium castaneum]|uniref:Transmembrane channel-like protein 7 n=1 Tax=Tribolium castaneum TaxID=7070 RepID=D6WFV4_TRICA|nr:PREDICTED: transmembrane channel-like protein 7 [Tribolium castaneum]EFA00942.1 Transmembrane channel-like protein 7 [Tribolium castaneum]|eukprot:XP_968201.1 PREDICTED: transmembrane channel-like protein 7 [Tribolium castaneum]